MGTRPQCRHRVARGARILGRRALTVQGTLVTVGQDPPPEAPLPSSLRPPRPFATWLLALAALAAGCVGAPVQEMSNARQAVRAAEHAGAATAAPDLMNEAKSLLKDAEANLRLREYRTARDEAEQARSKAVEARRVAEAAAAAKPKTP